MSLAETVSTSNRNAGPRRAALDATSLADVTAALAVHAPAHDADGSFPWPGIEAVHEAGLLTASVGRRYGGRPLTAREIVDVYLALGEGDPSVALVTAMTTIQHALQDATGFWPEALYERVLAESAERPTLINAIRAEPELGAPARGGLPTTVATRTPDGWSVSGHKGFGTGSEGLAYHLVWVVTAEDEPRVGHVIVPRETPGIRIEAQGLVKLITSRHAIAAVQGIVAAIGNPGLTRSLPFERHLRDVLCSRPHPPQDDAALLATGRALLLP